MQKVNFNDLSKTVQQSLIDFAKTDKGYKFLSQFAKNGDMVGNVEFYSDGKYSHHDIAIKEKYDHRRYARIYPEIKSVDNQPDDKITFNWEISTAYDKERNDIDRAITSVHEAFVHHGGQIIGQII